MTLLDKRIYLAYGSNLNLEQMKHRCPTAKVIGTTFLENYKLTFRGYHGSAVATIEPAEGCRVPVMLWSILPNDEKSLDSYEGYPRLYRKETVTVKMDGEDVETMVYIMNEGRPLGAPSLFYYGTIAEGYEDAGFDLGFLNRGVERSTRIKGGKLLPA